MKIIKQRVFDGRNIYSHKKCMRLDVDLCGYSEIPSKDIDGFNEGLLKIIPELNTHRCGIDEEHGFVKRLNEGTYLAHICEHIIIAIQNNLGIEVAYGKSREINGDLYYIIFQYEYKSTAIEVARLAIDIINSLINKENINYEGRFKLLKEILTKESIGPSTKAIIDAAKRYGMPFFELGDSGFYQIGYGKQARIIEATIGARTSCVAADIASDKLLTKELLLNQSIPVADGGKVCNVISLLKEGERIGYPLALKPRYGSKGEGVMININTEKELVRCYNHLKSKFADLILEKYIEGNDYRVCVIDYNIVAVSLRTPPFVIGNGKHNIKELIRRLNENPNRGYDHEKPLTKVKIDDQLLKELEKQGLSLVSIPISGERVLLRENANLSTGGMAVDCTNEICEENKELCIRAAKTIGLDICGIDIKSVDISKPLAGRGVVMEVNAAPGIRMHLHPSQGECRDVGEAILNMQYNGVPANIPLISVTGTNGKTTTTRLIGHVLQQMGYKVGMTSTDGIYVDGKCIDKGDDTGFYSAKSILQNKDVEIAVLETARGGLIRRGLAYDVADVSVITNITEDHIGLDDIRDMEELSFVKSLVGEAVKEDGYVVINGDDEWSKKILSRIKAQVIFFSKNKENPLIQKNIQSKGIAIYINNGALWVTNSMREYKILDIKSIPIALNGILEFNIENAMAACSALVGLGVDYCMISKGFKTFKLNNECNSGRFNFYDLDGIKVILDYGHNIEGYKSVINALSKIEREHLTGIIGVPGDRTDEIMMKIGKLCGEAMDRIIIKEDDDKRGRETGEVAKILERGILDSGNKKYEICLDEVEALKKSLSSSAPGDLIILFYEKLEPLLEVIKEYTAIDDDLTLANL